MHIPLLRQIRSIRAGSILMKCRPCLPSWGMAIVALALGLACGGSGNSPQPTTQTAPPVQGPGANPVTPVAAIGSLQVSGGQITSSETSQPIQLKGMSLFWSQWGSTYWNVSAVDQAVDFLGCQIIRAPLAVGKTDDNAKVPVDAEEGYLFKPEDNKARVKAVVNQAIFRGIYVIIDWHDSAAETHTEQAKAFFAEMATTYKNVPNVIFEIYNEPLTTDWSGLIKPYSEAVIKVIRDAGANNLILVGTGFFSQKVDTAAADPLSDSNIAYVMHFYAGTPVHAALRGIVDTVMAGGKAVFVSEWGTCDASGNSGYNEASSTEFLNWMDQHRISWCNWSLNDKAETASMFKAGTNPMGPWSDANLTTDGVFVKAHLPAPLTAPVTVAPSQLNFFFPGGEKSTTVTSTGDWSATSDQAWLSCSPASGSGTTSIAISTQANPDATERTGTINLTGPGGSKSRILINQKGNDGNLAAGQPTTASSFESASYKADYATDGDEVNTRWSSEFADPQWLMVDLGHLNDVAKVVLTWETACSSNYQIQISDTGLEGSWFTIYPADSATVAAGAKGSQTIYVQSEGRFIRMYSLTRATKYGCSLYEMKVYGPQTPSTTVVVDTGGTVKLQFMPIPAGRFLMGSPDLEQDRGDNEGPQHWVTISQPFEMTKYEITQNQWLSLMGSNPAIFNKGGMMPVEGITHLDITQPGGFLDKLNALTADTRPAGKVFRLPTEAEWEYACRAGTTTRFYWGDDPDYSISKAYAWTNLNSAGTTHRVGQLAPNAWGLYDMAGNVAEFCHDYYSSSYVNVDDTVANTDPTGPATGSMRQLRPGCWFYTPDASRSATRGTLPTGQDYRYNYPGFRVVLAAPIK